MTKLRTFLWTLIRKECDFDRIDWASAITLVLYGSLVLVLFFGIILGFVALFFCEFPPQ